MPPAEDQVCLAEGDRAPASNTFSWKIKLPFLCCSLSPLGTLFFFLPSLLKIKKKKICTTVLFLNALETDIEGAQQLVGFPDPVAS